MKRKTIGIVGYGYVGKGMARMFEDKYDIRVYDPHQLRYDEQGVNDADLVLICVPTPQRANGGCDVSIVLESIERFKLAKLICIKSTVQPGFTEAMISSYGNHVHFSPEYMGEGGNYVEAKYPDPVDARSHPFCIVGGHRAHDVLDFFRSVMATSARYVATSPTAAELAKYMENSFLATKVAFCNEFASIAAGLGVNYNDIRELWLQDPRIGASHTLVFPEQKGFNGKCLPKDLAAIRFAADLTGTRSPLLDAVAYYDMSAPSWSRMSEKDIKSDVDRMLKTIEDVSG